MIDDRLDIEDGFVCQECREPFPDGVGYPRSCLGCGGVDESRHDLLTGRT